MKRKDYKKPMVKTVKLQAAIGILAGSGDVAGVHPNYGVANSDVDESEIDPVTGEWTWN